MKFFSVCLRIFIVVPTITSWHIPNKSTIAAFPRTDESYIYIYKYLYPVLCLSQHTFLSKNTNQKKTKQEFEVHFRHVLVDALIFIWKLIFFFSFLFLKPILTFTDSDVGHSFQVQAEHLCHNFLDWTTSPSSPGSMDFGEISIIMESSHGLLFIYFTFLSIIWSKCNFEPFLNKLQIFFKFYLNALKRKLE